MKNFLFVVMLITACATPRTVIEHPWPTTAKPSALADVVQGADGYVLGTVVKAEADWTYDDPCGIIAGFLGRCDGTNTHKLTIQSSAYSMKVWVFVPARDTLPVPVGTRAIFIWNWYYAKRFADCRARAPMFSGTCPMDRLPAVLSLEAVASPSDSLFVADLFIRIRK
jgi:hypothetical protein